MLKNVKKCIIKCLRYMMFLYIYIYIYIYILLGIDIFGLINLIGLILCYLLVLLRLLYD